MAHHPQQALDVAAFNHQSREGMAEYMDRKADTVTSALDAQCRPHVSAHRQAVLIRELGWMSLGHLAQTVSCLSVMFGYTSTERL